MAGWAQPEDAQDERDDDGEDIADDPADPIHPRRLHRFADRTAAFPPAGRLRPGDSVVRTLTDGRLRRPGDVRVGVGCQSLPLCRRNSPHRAEAQEGLTVLAS
jgi:hypothetical protein